MTKLTQVKCQEGVGKIRILHLPFFLISLLCFKALLLQSSQHAAVQGVGEPGLWGIRKILVTVRERDGESHGKSSFMFFKVQSDFILFD